ncbi:nuclear transport factor 2 family protein [Microbacterium sp. J1-1]|uniref:nuclear transport factor 2 family protein n=1 Tax=Microbacterium sp. J1-1 TaxID=2992441 RepID=UPI0021150306|nr:nuclear transport factor 2 family protein [Microbacterium sp. J1-1]UUE20189.1 nuclear transport factor 2 family protein [Microbacterium sp. J1-1]
MSADLRTIGDRQDIAMLLARIAHLADAGDPEEHIACFTPDAIWDLTDATDLPMDVQTIRGRDALLAGVHDRRASGIQGPGTHTRHDISSIAVEIDEDRASARSYFRYYRRTDGAPTLAAMGVYADTFVRTAAGWRLHHRVISRG